MQLRFVLPGPLDASAPYPRAMVAALRGLGHSVVATTLGAMHPEPHPAAAATLQESITNERLVIDGALLGAFEPLVDQFIERDATLLVRGPVAAERALLARLRRIVVTTEAAQRRVAGELGIAADQLTLVGAGVPDAVRSVAPRHDASCRVLTIDTQLPVAEPAVLLRALARLPDLDWSLAVVTTVRGLSLRSLADELGIASRVAVIEDGDADKLEDLWQSAGLLALAMQDENDGTLVCEALRRGLPVAVAAGPPMPQHVPAEAGALAGRGDHVTLSNALRRIIFDLDLRRGMADAAWALGRKLPLWETQARRFVAALED